MVSSATLGNDLVLVLPVIIVSLGSLLILCGEAFIKGNWPKATVSALVLGLAALSGQVAALTSRAGGTLFGGFVYGDPFTLYMQLILLFGALLALLMGIDRLREQGIAASSEYYTLLLMATAGAMIFVAAAELITLFIGLEIMSLALYALCGSALSQRRSAESALKYFLLGSFSSAFLLYGIAILYGLARTTSIVALSSALGNLNGPMLYFGMGLLLVGLIFKIGAVPFHFWAPDVYEGAPTPVTAYMACVIKAAAFAAVMRVLWVGFEHVAPFWTGAIWIMSLLTMTLGNVVALRQRSVKRMLAYSSIAHAGYMMVAFLAPGAELGGGAAILFYLVAYTLMTMGAFGVVMVTTGAYSNHQAPDDISRFHGLSVVRPELAALMALFMLGLAGIPPGVAGLLGKFYVFGAAIKAHYTGLVIVAVINSAVSCYYYLRVIVAMYFIDPDPVEESLLPRPMGIPMAGALAVCAVGVLLFGIFPSLLYDSAAAVMLNFK